MKKLEEKRAALNKATSLGEAILGICHPDSITTIKHWNTIIKARFEEVSARHDHAITCRPSRLPGDNHGLHAFVLKHALVGGLNTCIILHSIPIVQFVYI